MFRMPESYDSWRLDTPPRFEDHHDPEQDGDGTDDDGDVWQVETGGEA